MKAKEIEALESYFKTENEYWNDYTREILCEVLKQGNFETPETPLQLFSNSIDIFTEHYKTPLKAVQEFATETEKQKLTPAQQLFVYEWVYKYVKNSEFDNLDTTEIKELLKSKIERLKNDKSKIENNKPLTGNIRDTLKELEPVQRLNILCKLIPYVLPKVESVTHTQGEPENETRNNGVKWEVPY